MAACPMVPKRGSFIGSGSSRFTGQEAADIYIKDDLPVGLSPMRISHYTVAWGTSVVMLSGLRPGGDENNTNDWLPIMLPNLLAGLLLVHHAGPVAQGPPPPVMFPNGIATFQYRGNVRQGPVIPWNSTTMVTRRSTQNHQQGGGMLRYRQPERRVGHDDDVIPGPREDGRQFKFTKLIYSSQVQNYRRISRLSQAEAQAGVPHRM